jgi:ubiquitin C-terminal hydrolase
MGQPEILEDGWKCGHCHSKEGAEKREAIIETNNILVLCLKRFQANGSKIKNMIDYPVSGLDVTEWLEERTAFGRQVYDLYGVCLHQGTMEYGHYRAYCRHFMSG